MQAHHILRWADAPSLRFDVNNGVTLCYNCHNNIVNKNEQHWAAFFIELVGHKRGKNEKRGDKGHQRKEG